MKTQLFNATAQKENGVRLAGSVIRAGGLVAFPTETVYGLGANGLSGEAVAKIFQAKGRPSDNPLILHIAKKSDAKDLWTKVPPMAQALMDTFWPGPLTLIFNHSAQVPPEVTAGLPTVALRMPDHKTALSLIRAAGVPIAAPSANLSGRPSPTTAQHVLQDLEGRIDIVLDGGPCRVGLESTVLSLCGAPTILRPGGVTREMLEAVIGPVELSPAVLAPLQEGAAAPSPGMKYKHYAPKAQVLIADGTPREAAERICRAYDTATLAGSRCMILATRETQGFYRNRAYAIIGDRRDPSTLCANLFAALRQYGEDADLLYCEALPEEEMGLAYMNRLLRAAGFQHLEHP